MPTPPADSSSSQVRSYSSEHDAGSSNTVVQCKVNTKEKPGTPIGGRAFCFGQWS
jgi:hypothetical protein